MDHTFWSTWKGGRRILNATPCFAMVFVVLASCFPLHAGPPPPNALPTGGQIMVGQASINQQANRMNITQTTPKLIANWQTFNIGSNAAVNFQQPNSSSVALNRVLSADPSRIYGSLTANGQVFLLNPSGVIFGKGARVDVGGLAVSTLNMKDGDFLAGRYIFEKGLNAGGIANDGKIQAVNGGYLAFIAPRIENNGEMTANQGTVAMAAGDKVSLDFAGDKLINFTVDKGAVDALVANRGLIKADGGEVILTAKAADELTQAVVNNTGIIEARTLEKNKAGRILLISDMASGETIVGGRLDASAPEAGDGGFIETSAAKVTIKDDFQVTTKAANGKTGTWLIDPKDFTIAAAGGDMTGAAVGAALSGGNLEIQSDSGGAGANGDIFVNDSVTWSANTLTLNAYRNIEINSQLNGSGSAKLSLLYGQGAVTVGNTAFYSVNAPVNLPAGNNFSTKLGSSGALDTYYVITSLGNPGSTTGTDLQGMEGNKFGNYALGANIDASTTSGWNAGAGFAPVGSDTITEEFNGKFEGLGHVITNLTINRPATDYVGLFGYVSAGDISNVGLVGGSVRGRDFTGALVGLNEDGTITNSYSTASITGTGDYVGGLVGYNDGGTIIKSNATGSVTGSGWYAGGLVGYNEGGDITNSYAAGSVTGTGDYVGGLAGYNDGGDITNSYATGSVTGSGWYVGGLVGHHDSGFISDSYATGPATGSDYVGGLVGNQKIGFITDSYAAGLVTSSGNFAGGLVGKALSIGIITDSYWDTTTSGQAASQGGTGKTTAEMKQLASFPAWDIDDAGGTGTVWRIYGDATYPLLRSFLMPLTLTAGDTKPYDKAPYAGGSYTASSVYDAGHLLGIPVYGGAAQGAVNAAAYALTLSGLYSDQQGYDLSLANGILTISPRAVTLTAPSVTKTYDGGLAYATQAADLTSLGSVLVDGDTVSAATISYTIKHAGAANKTVALESATISDGNAGNNYAVTLAGNATSTINKANLTITAATNTKTYDGTTSAAAIPTVAGIQAGDTVTGLTEAYDNKNAGIGKTLTVAAYTVNDGNSGNNYLVATATDATGVITSLPVTLTAPSVTKTYDGGLAYATQAADLASLAGSLVGGDTVSAATISYATKHAGTANKTVTLDSAAISDGNAGNNYAVTLAGNLTSTINKANLTVTATTNTKTYDGTTSAAAVPTVSGIQGGDTVTGLAEIYDNQNTGTGKTLTVNAYTVNDGNSGNNYLVTTVADTTGVITQAVSPAPAPVITPAMSSGQVPVLTNAPGTQLSPPASLVSLSGGLAGPDSGTTGGQSQPSGATTEGSIQSGSAATGGTIQAGGTATEGTTQAGTAATGGPAQAGTASTGGQTRPGGPSTFSPFVPATAGGSPPMSAGSSANASVLTVAPPQGERIVLLPDPEGRTGSVVITTARGEVILNIPYQTAVLTSRGEIETKTADAAEVQNWTGATLAVQPMRPVSFVLHFKKGTDELTAKSKQMLEQCIAELLRRSSPEVTIIGHTDSTGSFTYNDALSLRRAYSIRDILIEAGIDASKIEVIGRGKRTPLIPTRNGVPEPRNRRAEINIR